MDLIKIKYETASQPRIAMIDKGNWIDIPAFSIANGLNNKEIISDLKEPYQYKAGEHFLIGTGFAIELPAYREALVAPRGSTFKSFGIIITNSPGVIDESYKGDTDYWFITAFALRDGQIKAGDRVAQFRIINKMDEALFMEVDSLNNENRGGYGSTGTSEIIQ